MVKFICCGSSSSGNGYILSCGGEHLIIELGVNFDEYRKILNDKGGTYGCARLFDLAPLRTTRRPIQSISLKRVEVRFARVLL